MSQWAYAISTCCIVKPTEMITMFDKTPLYIVVSENRWDAIGVPSSRRQRWLFATLKSLGGISDTVPPGNYYFNVERRGFNLFATLDPIEL